MQIITGDFNAEPEENAIRYLVRDSYEHQDTKQVSSLSSATFFDSIINWRTSLEWLY